MRKIPIRKIVERLREIANPGPVVGHMREGCNWFPLVRFGGRDVVLDTEGIVSTSKRIDELEHRLAACQSLHSDYHDRINQASDLIGLQSLRIAAAEKIAKEIVRIDREAGTRGMLMLEYPRLRGMAEDFLASLEEKQPELARERA